MAARPEPVLLTAEQFLRIEWGSDIKAELDNGVIRMMAGGTRAHARVQGNILSFLAAALRGSGCRPFGSDMAVATHAGSVRYPDALVDCGPNGLENDEDKAVSDPRVIVEVLSPSTRREDEGAKLAEYRLLPTVDTIALIDTDIERIRVLQRVGGDDWDDRSFTRPADLVLPALNVTIPHHEIFARD